MTLKAGRDLDALVAEKVMGFTVHPQKAGTGVREGSITMLGPALEDGTRRSYWHPSSPWVRDWSGVLDLPSYSTDIAAAWEVIKRVRSMIYSKRFGFEMHMHELASRRAGLKLGLIDARSVILKFEPVDICLAALAAVDGSKTQGELRHE